MTAPSNTSTDPFSIFEDALWSVLDSFAPLAELVKFNNRIRLTGSNDQPFKPSIVAGDLPELLVIPDGGSIDKRTSDGRNWNQRYAVGLSTDQLRTNTPTGINAVKWALFRALTIAESQGRFKGLRNVISVDFSEYQESAADPSPLSDRKIRGWKAVLALTAVFRFNYSELTA